MKAIRKSASLREIPRERTTLRHCKGERKWRHIFSAHDGTPGPGGVSIRVFSGRKYVSLQYFPSPPLRTKDDCDRCFY